jgi:hypothetical protein
MMSISSIPSAFKATYLDESGLSGSTVTDYTLYRDPSRASRARLEESDGIQWPIAHRSRKRQERSRQFESLPGNLSGLHTEDELEGGHSGVGVRHGWNWEERWWNGSKMAREKIRP